MPNPQKKHYFPPFLLGMLMLCWGIWRMDWRTTMRYDYVGKFVEGKAKVEKNGRFGFINEDMEVVIPIAFDEVQNFSNNTTIVKKQGKYGMLDGDGEFIIPFQYDGLEFFSEGLAAVRVGERWGFINRKNEVVIPIHYDVVYPFKGGKATVTKHKATYAINAMEECLENCPLASYYDYVKFFDDGLFVVRLKGKVGIVTKDNQAILPIEFDAISPLKQKVSIIYFDQWYGLIDEQGELITPITYDKIERFGSSKYPVLKVFMEGKVGAVNLNGKVIIPSSYDEIVAPELETIEWHQKNYLKVRSKNKWGYFDLEGNEILPIEFEELIVSDGFIYTKKQNRWGVFDRDGKKILKNRYVDCLPFSEGMIAIKVKGKWGYCDEEGTWKIAPQYNQAGYFKNGQAWVTKGNINYLIDKKGGILKVVK